MGKRLERRLRGRIVQHLYLWLRLDERPALRRWLRRHTHPARFGNVRRTTPLSDCWGYDRGTPTDRVYVERFLEAHRGDIRGRVLEVKDSGYTERYGSGVRQSEVLDIDPANPHATIVADLAAAAAIPDDRFDCFVLVQTLQFIYDMRAALGHAHRILRPGGVLLLTVPGISRTDRRLAQDYWRFTIASCTALLEEVFGPGQVTVESHGNVFSAMAFLTGMSREELTRAELEANDPHFPVIVAARAVKARPGQEH